MEQLTNVFGRGMAVVGGSPRKVSAATKQTGHHLLDRATCQAKRLAHIARVVTIHTMKKTKINHLL